MVVVFFCIIIKDVFSFNIVLSGPFDLELIFVSIKAFNTRNICLGVFYRPPSAPVNIFDMLFDVLCFALLAHLWFQILFYLGILMWICLLTLLFVTMLNTFWTVFL